MGQRGSAGRAIRCAGRARARARWMLNTGVVARAKRLGAAADHHPSSDPRSAAERTCARTTPEGRLLCELIRERALPLIAMHTNYDIAAGGVNDALASALGACETSQPARSRICCAGDDRGSARSGEFAAHAEMRVGAALCALTATADKTIRRVAVLGGSGGGYAPIARDAGADAFVTGKLGYHAALDARRRRACAVLEAGHAATELPAIPTLAEGLQKAANACTI